jgi:hypothetical protein
VYTAGGRHESVICKYISFFFVVMEILPIECIILFLCAISISFFVSCIVLGNMYLDTIVN